MNLLLESPPSSPSRVSRGSVTGRPDAAVRLEAGDLDQVLQLARGLVSITEYDQLQPALGQLARVVGSDTGTLTHLDLETRREVAVRWPGWPGEVTRLQAYAHLWSTHPLRRAVSSQHHVRAWPVATSDVLSERQWRDHPLRREAMPEVTDQLSVLLARNGTAVQALTLGRLGGTFTARQKAILHATQPFVVSAVNLARPASHQALQISPAPLRWVPADSAPGVVARVGSAALGRLTPREREVLGLVAEGLTDAQVARRLELAPATVSKHLRRIYARVGVPNRAAAVRFLLGGDPHGS